MADWIEVLAEQAKAGDDSALARLFAPTYSVAWEAVRAEYPDDLQLPGSRHSVYDVPLIVALELVIRQGIRKCEWRPGRQSWAGYVRGRVRRRILDLYKKRAVQWESLDAEPALSLRQAPGDAADRGSARVEAARVLRILRRTGRRAAAWALREIYLRGRTYAETAQRLGVPEGTLKARLHRQKGSCA